MCDVGVMKIEPSEESCGSKLLRPVGKNVGTSRLCTEVGAAQFGTNLICGTRAKLCREAVVDQDLVDCFMCLFTHARNTMMALWSARCPSFVGVHMPPFRVKMRSCTICSR
jgi:hypothetical protein